jgi:hypothetical protein
VRARGRLPPVPRAVLHVLRVRTRLVTWLARPAQLASTNRNQA